MQKIKRIVKKIGAISTGAAFLGASLMGAMAADLSEYPSPFVSGGKANSAVIIHSSNGMDATAAGYVLSGLSGAITATGGTAVTSVVGGYKLEYSGNKFNLNDTAYDIDNKLSKTQMPVLLKKETYVDDEGTNKNTVEYNQNLLLTNRGSSNSEKTLWYIYDQDSEDSDKPMGDFVYISKASDAYAWTYEFDLDNAITVANSADLESTKLNLLGRKFTISSAAFTTGNVSKLTLLAGDVTQVIATGDVVNGVKVVAVDVNGNSCNVEYQGAIYTINKGSTKTMSDGTIIGVSKVTPSNKQATPDYCELNIGADEVVLENGKEVKVNSAKITGSKVTFGSTQGFDQFNVSFKPDKKVYLKSGDEYKDPVFGAFKAIIGNVVDDNPEDILLTASGEKVDLTATNKDGDTTTWTIAFANTTGTGDIMPGADRDEPFIALQGDFLTNTSMGESELSGMTGIRFLFSKNDRSHIIRIKSIDTLNNKTTFYDETTKTEFTDQAWTSNTSTSFSFLPTTFSLTFGRANEYPIGVNSAVLGNDAIRFDSITDKGASYVLRGGGNITFNSNWSGGTGITGGISGEGDVPGLPTGKSYWMTFAEIDAGKETSMLLSTVRINLTYSSANQEINFAAVTANNNFVHTTTSLKQKNRSDTTLKAAKTVYGTYVEQITPTGSGTDSITIKTPDTASYINMWMSPVDASVSTEGASAVTGIDLKSEDEVTDVSAYNAIVVGGPAANKIAASLLGLEYPAYGAASNLEAGEAILKLVSNGANTALLVFGWEKDDTARAAKVLQSYDAYDLTGAEASVEGTTANPTIATSA